MHGDTFTEFANQSRANQSRANQSGYLDMEGFEPDTLPATQPDTLLANLPVVETKRSKLTRETFLNPNPNRSS